MAKQGSRTPIVIDSALTRSIHAQVLLLLGVWSWVFAALVVALGVLVWASVTTGQYLLLIVYVLGLVGIYVVPVAVAVTGRRNRGAYIPVRYTFQESGVTKEARSVRQALTWKDFVKWKKVGPYYVIYQTRRGFFVIPVSRIPGDRRDEFELLLRQNVRKR